MTAQPITTLIADDHPVFREGLRFTLTQAPDIHVVGVATTGHEAVRLSAEVDPDIVIMDVNMPELDGLSATQQLTSRGPRPRVLVLTMYEDDQTVLAALKAGASGYLLKGADPAHVTNAVRAVASGHAIFGSTVAARMLEDFSPVRPARAEAFPELSRREREVLSHLADGLTNQQIAAQLYISPITVRNHVSSILAKLQLSNRRQAMIRARGADR